MSADANGIRQASQAPEDLEEIIKGRWRILCGKVNNGVTSILEWDVAIGLALRQPIYCW